MRGGLGAGFSGDGDSIGGGGAATADGGFGAVWQPASVNAAAVASSQRRRVFAPSFFMPSSNKQNLIMFFQDI